MRMLKGRKQTQRALITVMAIAMAMGPVLAGKKMVERTTSAALGGTERYLAHISTDKPIYRTGEKVYVRSVVLHAANHTPMTTAAPAWACSNARKLSRIT